MRALVVDDSKAIRIILGRALRELGYETAEAAGGAEALEALAAAPAGLLLVDWNMPGMSGLELVLAVRSRPALKSVAIVMVTTESESSSISKALEAGANEFIMKPFTKEALRSKLELLGLPGPKPA